MAYFNKLVQQWRKLSRPLKQRLQSAPILDSRREYVSDGLTPERIAACYKAADTGDIRRQSHLFEQMEEKDPHLLGERTKRVKVVRDVKFTLTPASDSARDMEIYEFVKKHTLDLSDWGDTVEAMQDAVGKGFSALEPVWDMSEGQGVIEHFEFLEQKRFTFRSPQGLLSKTPRLLTDTNMQGIDIPDWQLVIRTYGGKTGHPAKSGVFRPCSWMYLFKNYSIKDWVVFCERVGKPLMLGKYPAQSQDSVKTALMRALRALGSDAYGIIPENSSVEFIESQQKSASSDLYFTLANFCNKEVSKAILGQTLSADIGDVGSKAAADTHKGIMLDLILSDGREIATVSNQQIITPLVGFNFGWDAPLPIMSASMDLPEDMEAKSKTMERITKIIAVPASYVRKELRIPEQDGNEEMIGGPQQPNQFAAKITTADPPSKKKSKKYTPEQQALEDNVDSLVQQVDFSANEQLILDYVQSWTGALEGLRDSLITIWDDLDVSSLVSALETGLLNAHMHGRRVQQALKQQALKQQAQLQSAKIAAVSIKDPFDFPNKDAESFWFQKRLVSPEEFKALTADQKVQAFSVASIAKGDELQGVYDALDKAIKDGTGLAQFKKDAADIFAKRGWDKNAPWRIDLILRQNMLSQYSLANRKELSDGFFPVLQWSAVGGSAGDGRTRPLSRALHGKAYPYNHPFWRKYWPGLVHIQDRCTALGKTRGAVRREGIEVESEDLDGKTVTVDVDGKQVPVKIEPQKGFGADPDKVIYGDQLDLYRDKLNSWPDSTARASTQTAVQGQYLELWAKNAPKGGFPVAVVPDKALDNLHGVGQKVVTINGTDVDPVRLSAYGEIQDVLDNGTWEQVEDGWIVSAGERVLKLDKDLVVQVVIN